MFDELSPEIEEIQAMGAVVLLKWDGERATDRCTVVITRQDTGYAFREDSDEILGALDRAIAHFRSRHQQ